MKRLVKSKHFKRSLGLLVALLSILAVIFVFTPPLLAPELSQPDQDNSQQNSGKLEGSTYDSTDSTGSVGENIKAGSFLVFDQGTGKEIASRKENTPVAIASLTKLMTAYVVQKYGKLDDTWAINQASTNDTRPVLGLTIGDRVVVKDLVNSMLVGSANDAAAALGAYMTSVQKKSILELMNTEANNLGMSSTHYENPIGFDSEQNYSTAKDLKQLVLKTRALKLFTEIDRNESYSFSSETGHPYSVKATNSLLSTDSEIHAVKTGFTDEARGAMITAISHNNQNFVMIILDSPDREADTILLKHQVIASLAQ